MLTVCHICWILFLLYSSSLKTQWSWPNKMIPQPQTGMLAINIWEADAWSEGRRASSTHWPSLSFLLNYSGMLQSWGVKAPILKGGLAALRTQGSHSLLLEFQVLVRGRQEKEEEGSGWLGQWEKLDSTGHSRSQCCRKKKMMTRDLQPQDSIPYRGLPFNL